MHLFGVIIWLGGLMFQNAILQPVVQFESDQITASIRKVNKRFIGFIWMSVWTIFVTGLIMMLLSSRFEWFRYDDRWSVLLGLKQLIFVLMIFYAFGYARMLEYATDQTVNGRRGDKVERSKERADQFRKVSIFLGITGILLAMAMK